MGYHSLLQRIFQTQGLNLGLVHYRQTVYCLGQQGSSWCILGPELTSPYIVWKLVSSKCRWKWFWLLVTIGIHAQSQSCCTLLQPCGLPPGLFFPWDFPSKNTLVSCHFPTPGGLPNQGSNPSLLGLLHWQADSLLLRHLGSIGNWHKGIMHFNYIEA